MSEYQILKKAGPLRNGWERGKGSIWHAIPARNVHDTAMALCGTRPGIMWSMDEGQEITCPRCKRIATMEPNDHGRLK
jgi:hypothetical protein